MSNRYAGTLGRFERPQEEQRWARPQSVAGYWHFVVADVLHLNGFYEQVTICGRRIIQSEEWMGLGSREWLGENTCPRCAAKRPITNENTPGWDRLDSEAASN